MATISSHVLDSVIGTHARGIRVLCHQRHEGGSPTLVFDVCADDDGRIAETIQASRDSGALEFELVFHSGDYYARQPLTDDGYQIMNTIVIRLTLPDPDARFHVPIMLAPHSYSVWWSGVPGPQT